MSQSNDAITAQASYRSRWASIAIRENIAAIQKAIPSLPNDVSRHKLVPIADTLRQDDSDDKPLKVCIIGAGVAGLFTALIFDHLREICDLQVDYEILEKNSEERLGGRLFSYYFKDVKDPGPHDYYDVGAMRFPEIDVMKRTFGLFEKVCHMKFNKGEDPERGDLIPYYLNGRNTPELYNDIQVVRGDKDDKPTGKTFRITGIPDEYLDETPGFLVDDQIKEFTSRFKDTIKPAAGWNYLMKKGDQFSVRQFLQQIYDYDTIEWLETYSYGNRWYDQALSEMVLEDLDFNHNKDWWCVEGGSQEVAHRMRAKIEMNKTSISFGKEVTAMTRSGEDGETIDVSVKSEAANRHYDAVFNSAPLGTMQRMDLSGLNLNWGTKQAIRSLGYGASCKVGIRFKNLWWIEELGIDSGGVAKTDLPLRVCVYPSYNLRDKCKPGVKGKPGVLLCSYTWSQEAQRIAALINGKSPQGEEELRTLLIHDLAKLHSKTGDNAEYKRIHKMISDSYETHYAYDWYADPGTTGAFAYFGPQQFRNMYPWITRTDGKHIIIGEAASAHHAWVVGALESAVRGVYQFLFKHSDVNKTAHRALQKYNKGEIKGPWGPLPYEYDREKDVQYMSTLEKGKVPKREGELAREQVLFETIRQKQGGDQLVCEDVTKKDVAPLLEAAKPA